MILNCDCIEYMNSLPDDSFDMVFTSPPFKDEDVPGDYWEWYDKFYNECIRVSKYITCIFHSSTKLNYLISHYPPKRIMIWGKGAIKISYRYNPILVYDKNGCNANKYIWSDCIGAQPLMNKWKCHKYQDPQVLYTTIIKMFNNCKSVYDPCGGSGTTALSCIELGLDYTLTEIDKTNYELICNRVNKVAKYQYQFE